MKRLLNWWKKRRLVRAIRIVGKAGLSVVRIVDRVGTKYIVDKSGTMYRLGKGGKA